MDAAYMHLYSNLSVDCQEEVSVPTRRSHGLLKRKAYLKLSLIFFFQNVILSSLSPRATGNRLNQLHWGYDRVQAPEHWESRRMPATGT